MQRGSSAATALAPSSLQARCHGKKTGIFGRAPKMHPPGAARQAVHMRSLTLEKYYRPRLYQLADRVAKYQPTSMSTTKAKAKTTTCRPGLSTFITRKTSRDQTFHSLFIQIKLSRNLKPRKPRVFSIFIFFFFLLCQIYGFAPLCFVCQWSFTSILF